MDRHQRSRIRALERALDELLLLYGERRRLEQIRAANLRAWRDRQERSRVKLAIGVVVVVMLSGVASGMTILQAEDKTVTVIDGILKFSPLVVSLVALVRVFTVVRETTLRHESELAKMARQDVMDAKLTGLENLIRSELANVVRMIEGLQREVERNRPRGSNREAS